MFDPSVWGWPQWTYFVLMVLTLAGRVVLHGKSRDGEKWNGLSGLFNFSLAMFLLVFGGFFA